MDREDKERMISRFQKLARAINKYDPSLDRAFDIERLRGYNPKSLSYEKLMELSPEDPLWITLSRMYFNEPQYQRIIMYYATLFFNYYYVTPVDLPEKPNKKKLDKEYNETLTFLDDEIGVENFTVNALKDILVEGSVFYYYDFINMGGKVYFQMSKLPRDYCTIIGTAKNGQMPIFQLDISFVDQVIASLVSLNVDITREDVLRQYPKGIRSAYNRYKNDGDRWIIVTPVHGIAFTSYNGLPPFAGIIKQIVRMVKFEEVRDNYIEDSLQKILFQKVDVDDNGDPEIDLALAAEFHENLKKITRGMDRVNALTSLADVEVLDLSDTSRENDLDFIDKFEDKMYNEAGVPKAVFNGNTAGLLDFAAMKDESFIWNIMDSISTWLSFICNAEIGARKKRTYNFVVSFLPISYRNREKMMDTYLKNAQYGYSKIIPQIAVGVKQRHFESLLYLENDLLKLDKRLVPLMSSHTLSGKAGTTTKQTETAVDEVEGGRPESSTEEKTDETLSREESK